MTGTSFSFVKTECVVSKKVEMKLNLQRPLIIFDLETTGLDILNDRITQLSYIKVFPDGTEKRNNLYFNPGKPIPIEVVNLTGITDEMVADKPTFKEL